MASESDAFRGVQSRIWSTISQLIDDCEELVHVLDAIVSRDTSELPQNTLDWLQSTPKRLKPRRDPFVSSPKRPSSLVLEIEAPSIYPLEDSATIQALPPKAEFNGELQAPSVEYL